MISGQSIICYAPNTWLDIWRNRHQIMTRLARENRVLFVEPTLYSDQVVSAVRTQGLAALRGARLRSPWPNLWVYNAPTYAPVSGAHAVGQLAFALRRRDLRQTLRRLGMAQPILWIFQYNLGEMIGHLDERLAIYHAVDEYSAYRPQAGEHDAWRERVRQLELDVIHKVDLVFVTSPALYESKHSLHPHVVYVPNGVDYDLFAQQRYDMPPPGAPNSPLLPDLAGVPRPWIGYSGVINEKLDLELLIEVVRSHPAWRFIFIGPVTMRYEGETLATLQALPNAHFLGRKQVEELPAYIAACDACIIPYKRNEWTRNISPLKLYEYLATGAPIVATAIPAAQEFAGSIGLANTPAAFAAALRAAMAADSPARRRQQQTLAQHHTWDDRIETLSNAITNVMAAKWASSPDRNP